MLISRLSILLAVLAGTTMIPPTIMPPPAPTVAASAAAKTIHGKIETAGNKKITIIDDEEDRQTFDVDSAAKITLDGKNVTLENLTKWASVAVTTKKGNDSLAVAIAAESLE